MAGITHSAFRRLLADFGGYGALFTEMLSAKMILQEDLSRSPWLKRRPQEGRVIYQLLVVDTDRLPAILERLAALAPDGLDLNGACPAPTIKQQRGGADLFEDADRLRDIVRVLRRHFAGPLTVKIRLGRQTPRWRARLGERLRLLADEGVDALTIHPRFAEDKLKRSARHGLYAELAAEARLPIIANGDIMGPDYVREHAASLASAAGLMIGRLAAMQPWIFAQWRQPTMVVQPDAVWRRLYDYIVEDFAAPQALARVKIFTAYFARNFLFGHTLFKTVQVAPDLAAARTRADAFFATAPARCRSPSLEGI
ncbi:MAG: tRNA-dihydrouridine synthase family protein [Kiritimatiellaeota bacterium]|nr:tRNA-dihydrouridine synthase family protein [Kiritimatiellota bacterium]